MKFSITSDVKLVKFESFSKIMNLIINNWEKVLDFCKMREDLGKDIPKLELAYDALRSTNTDSQASNITGTTTKDMSINCAPILTSNSSASDQGYNTWLDGNNVLDNAAYINDVLNGEFDFGSILLINNPLMQFRTGITMDLDIEGNVIMDRMDGLTDAEIGNMHDNILNILEN
jgi:hypothetical protein